MKPPQFPNIPLIGQQQQQQNHVMGQMASNLSQAIYIQWVTHGELSLPNPDIEQMRGIARDSMAAARAYLEGIGAIQIEQENKDG